MGEKGGMGYFLIFSSFELNTGRPGSSTCNISQPVRPEEAPRVHVIQTSFDSEGSDTRVRVYPSPLTSSSTNNESNIKFLEHPLLHNTIPKPKGSIQIILTPPSTN